MIRIIYIKVIVMPLMMTQVDKLFVKIRVILAG